MPILPFVARATTLAAFVVWHALVWWLGWLGLVVTFRGKAARQAWFGRRLIALFCDLGATFIKVGQIMSTRPDLLPPHVIKALETLQDQVPPFHVRWVEQALIEDFGRPAKELFTAFDPKPVASASVAQVHRATLPGGVEVAVKVRRPKIEQLVRFDLAVMRWFASVLALRPSYRLLGPVEAAEEFGRGIHAQLDFTTEAANNARFRANFAGDPDVIFPRVHAELSSRRVLTMDFIEGVKVLKFDETRHDPTRIAQIGFRVMFKMIFEDGFVHADLHPGNIFVTPEGKVAILDLGLVGELDDRHRKAFARYFAAWAQGDGKTMAKIMGELSPSRGAIPDPAAFEAAVETFVKKWYGKRMGEVQIGQIVYDMMQILRKHRVRVNPTFTLVNIAIAVTEGIGKQLDPSLDLMNEAMPFFAKFHFFAESLPN